MTLLITYLLLITLASVADGTVEGYEFDARKSFERKFKKSPTGFWGSKSHQNKNTWWYKISGGVWDFYHLADDFRKYAYITPFIIIYYQVHGFNWPSILYLSAYIIISIIAKRLSMWWIRN